MIIFYTLCFTYLIDTLTKTKEQEIEKPKVKRSTSKKTTKKGTK